MADGGVWFPTSHANSLLPTINECSSAASGVSVPTIPALTHSRLCPGPEPVAVPKRQEHGLKNALAQVPAIAVAVLMTMVNSVTYGSLCFQGLAGSVVPNGIVIWLLGTVAAQAVVICMSRLPAGIAAPGLEMVAIFHAIFPRVGAAIPDGEPGAVLGTILATIFTATLLLGILLIIGSRFGCSRWLRVVPLVVLKGALFGIALFLLQSGVSLAAPEGDLSETWPRVLATMALGLTLFLVDEKMSSPILVATLLLAIALAPVVAERLHFTTTEYLRAGGWLFPLPDAAQATSAQQHLWYEELLTTYATVLPQISWRIVLSQAPAVAGAWLVHVFAGFMDMKAIQLLTQIDIDVDAEMHTLGYANMLSAFMGGWPVYLYCSMNVTCYKLGGRTRMVGLIVLSGAIGALFVVQAVVPHLPRALPGCVALWLGLSFMKETFVHIVRQHSHTLDIMIVATMAILVISVGFLEALAVGFVLAVASFTFQYAGSRAAVRVVSDASFFRSNVCRPLAQHQVLERFGYRIAVVHVDGYLMFGSSPLLVDTIDSLLASESTKWVVLSFRGVQGIDYTAALDLVGLGRSVAKAQRHMLLTGLRSSVSSTLGRAGVILPAIERGKRDIPVGLVYVEHYSQALQCCEDMLLSLAGFPSIRDISSSPSQDVQEAAARVLMQSFGDFLDEPSSDLAELQSYFDLVDYPAGTIVLKAGDPATYCLCVVKGEVQLFLPRAGGHAEHALFETCVVGSLTGFMDMVNQTPYLHTAIVPAHVHCMALVLRLERYAELSKNQQSLSTAFLRALLRRQGQEARDMLRLAYL